eukprot:15352307-Alexandrium_andersonii.AAC.1
MPTPTPTPTPLTAASTATRAQNNPSVAANAAPLLKQVSLPGRDAPRSRQALVAAATTAQRSRGTAAVRRAAKR